MIVLKHILVATDFSPAAAAALIYGRALAHNFNATLHVLHVADNFFLRPTAADPHTLKTALARRLDALLSDDDRRGLRARATLDTSDHPADAIIDYARQADIDLVIMGTHGRTGMSQLFVGSVAERVVRTAPCPVLIIKHPEHEFVLPDAAGTQQEARLS